MKVTTKFRISLNRFRYKDHFHKQKNITTLIKQVTELRDITQVCRYERHSFYYFKSTKYVIIRGILEK